MTPHANPYASNSVTTAAPERLVTMLYDRLLTALTRSRVALDDGGAGIGVVNAELQRAQMILDELSHTLDRERGGDVASGLASLYAYCHELVVRGNVRKDAFALSEAEQIVTGVREAWVQACDTPAVTA